MTALITLLVLASLLAGLVLGWYLRRVNAWCSLCGEALACTGCRERPTWSSPGRAHRPASS